MEGLRRLCAEQAPGRIYTYDEIASATGMTDRYIEKIERQALKKIRSFIPPEFHDFFKKPNV